jgi:putative peptide zinc metalloprotease protein
MAQAPQTFSESWYRVADQHVSLRPGVKVRRQQFRGELWYVLEDPFNNQFFRLRSAAHDFVVRLRADRTVQEVWQECLQRSPDAAPGQEEVIRLISQLYFANLLQYEMPADSARLFERYKRRREREAQSFWLNIMFARIPLLDPDAFLDRIKPVVRAVISPVALVIWLVVVGWGFNTVIDHFPELRLQSQRVLAPGNLFLLYLALIIVKSLHEFGHAFACKRYGGEVHVLGVMILIFTPTPFMDATSSWGFRSRRQRVLVGAAGMMVELFVASFAAFFWASSGPGTAHNLAYNIMFIASVSTVLFNGNPLLRYDGYYILSDLLDIPNLYQRSWQQLKFLAENYLFGTPHTESPTRSRREGAWLVVYGILSYLYRIIVFGGILLFLADRFLLLGIIMAAVCAISWVLVPVIRFVKYLAASPELERNRPRAIAVSLGLAAVVIGFLGVFPWPCHFRAPGILEAQQKSQVVNHTAGTVAVLQTRPGYWVKAGQPLFQLKNPNLDLRLEAARARYAQAEALRLLALQNNGANLKPVESEIAAVTKQLQRLAADRATLTVRAPQDGIWVAPQARDFLGRWLPRGTPLGLIVDPHSFYFTATVAQADGSWLFAHDIRGAEVRLRGQAGTQVNAGAVRIIPAGQSDLPSAALGWKAGGDVPVAPTDPQGVRTVEPFFEVKAQVPTDAPVALFHGRSGKIRFNLAPEPLLEQWYRRLRQLLQRRYKL